MKVTAHIENNGQGLYSVYVEEDLPFGLIGEGFTIEEAKEDFIASYEEMREAHRKATGEDVCLDVEFTMDVTAFLQHYKGVLSLAGLSKVTNVNKAQLSQYVCGRRNMSTKTEDNIKKSIRANLNEMLTALG